MRAVRFKACGAGSCLVVLLSWALGQAAPAAKNPPAQEKPPSKSGEQPAATFHAESRLVIVDVVVTGPHRQPVTGLAQSDFTLLEDGKPQQIQFFEAHVPAPAAAAPTRIQLPPHQYANVSTQSPSSINIVLFDVLNTPLTDQPYAREQMLQFLKTLPSGQQVALFELGTQLRMIAGFTTTSDDLVAAARKVVPHSSELLDTQEERQQTEDQLGLMREGSRNQEFFDSMQQFMTDTWEARDQNRANETVKAFGELARAVSGFRGRKNVIWLSEEFPVYFGPNLNPNDPYPNLRSYADLMRDTAGVLSSSQMSIYPIDIRGLVTGGIANAGSGGRAPGNGQVLAIENLHIAMDELAKQTGGRAYYNTNDLRLAMQRSFENGSHYYTLAYAPRNRAWDSKYHRIKVQLARSGLQAEYRKGYFATPERQPSEDEAHAELLSAIQPATPQSTMLLLKAQVLPPDREHAKVRIDCIVDGTGLAFTDGPGDRKNARLQFITVAWDKNLKAAVNATHTVELSLPPDKYENAIHNGIAAHQELQLQPGSYNVRMGVMDDGSKKIGTLDIPLLINETKNTSTK